MNGNQNSRIVNPFSKTVMTLKVNDQFQTELIAPELPPDQVMKILDSVKTEVLMQYIKQGFAEATKQTNTLVEKP